MAGTLITALLGQMPDASFNRLYGLTLGWYSDPVILALLPCPLPPFPSASVLSLFLLSSSKNAKSAVLCWAAAQVLGLFMDARPQAFLKKKKTNKLFGLFLHTLLKASVSHAEDCPSDGTSSWPSCILWWSHHH